MKQLEFNLAVNRNVNEVEVLIGMKLSPEGRKLFVSGFYRGYLLCQKDMKNKIANKAKKVK